MSIYLPKCAPPKELFTYTPNMYLSILSDNTIIIKVAIQEIGQGVITSLPMMLAEELDADWSKVKSEFLNYDKNIPDYSNAENGMQGTGGSTATHRNWMVLREAGASVRHVLIKAAAQKWKIDHAQCFTENGIVKNKINDRELSYGELAEQAATMELPTKVDLKKHKDFSVIGKASGDLKSERVVRGEFTYGIDVKQDNMVYAAIEIQPVKNAKLLSYSKVQVLAVEGVIDVVEIDQHPKERAFDGIEGGVAVIANSTWAAFQGKKALNATIQWDAGKYGKASIKTLRRDFESTFAGKMNEDAELGNIKKAFSSAEKQLEATYESPYLAHALMEPLSAIAHVQNNKCEFWAGTQSPQYNSVYIAKVLGIPAENMVFNCYPSGGGFGRRYFTDYTGQAALISQKIGRKVKLVWTREDEIRNGKFHPFRQDYYKGALDENNNLSAMHFRGVTTHEWGAAPIITYHVPNRLEESKIIDSIVIFGSWRSVVFHNQTLHLRSRIVHL